MNSVKNWSVFPGLTIMIVTELSEWYCESKYLLVSISYLSQRKIVCENICNSCKAWRQIISNIYGFIFRRKIEVVFIIRSLRSVIILAFFLMPSIYHLYFFKFKFSFCLRVWTMKKTVTPSGGRQRDSAVHTRESVLPQAPPSRAATWRSFACICSRGREAQAFLSPLDSLGFRSPNLYAV